MSLFSILGSRYCLIGLRALKKAELWSQLRRPFSSSALMLSRSSTPSARDTRHGEVHPGYIKIRKLMEQYQIDDGVPVHLKAGGRDKLLFAFTLLLCAVGLFMTFHFYYKMIYPEKPKDN